MHLIGNDVESVTRETFYSAVEMGKTTLQHLGFNQNQIDRLANTYIKHDLETLHKQIDNRDDEKALISIAKSARDQLEQTLEADRIEELSNEGKE